MLEVSRGKEEVSLGPMGAQVFILKFETSR